jgi:hypothetical protein
LDSFFAIVLLISDGLSKVWNKSTKNYRKNASFSELFAKFAGRMTISIEADENDK